jgi:ATP-binding cassette, subfamily C, bacterial
MSTYAPRVKTPTVLQIEAIECGVASLDMVLQYCGYVADKSELRNACKLSSSGTSTTHLIEAARAFKLEATLDFVLAEKALEQPMPQIITWNEYHYVVLEGGDDQFVTINDPEAGRRKITRADFLAGFSGVTVLLKPGEDFQKKKQPNSIKHAIKTHILKNKLTLTFLLVAGVMLAFPGLLMPIYSQNFIDEYLIRQHHSIIKPLLLMMLVTVIFQSLLYQVQSLVIKRLSIKVSIDLNARYLGHLLRLPLHFFYTRTLGDLVSRIKSNNSIAEVIGGRLFSSLINLSHVLIYLGFMFLYSITLALVVLGLQLVNLLFYQVVKRKRARYAYNILQKEGVLISETFSLTQNTAAIRAVNRGREMFSRWVGIFMGHLNIHLRLAKLDLTTKIVPLILMGVTHAFILGFGGWLIIMGRLTVGQLIAFQGIAHLFMLPFKTLFDLSYDIQKTVGDLKRLEDVMGESPDRERAAEITRVEPVSQFKHYELKAINFDFQYQNPPLIHDLSLLIRAGEHVGIYGENDVGKSALSKLLAGLYQPDSGEVTLLNAAGEVDSGTLLGRYLTLSDKKQKIFEASVFDNIVMGKANMTLKTVRRVCELVCIDAMVLGLSDGYQHILMENGRNLSVGEKQSLLLARAIAHDAPLLILDDVLCYMDKALQRRVLKNLRSLACAIVYFSRDKSLVKQFDTQYRLTAGALIQDDLQDVNNVSS